MEGLSEVCGQATEDRDVGTMKEIVTGIDCSVTEHVLVVDVI